MADPYEALEEAKQRMLAIQRDIAQRFLVQDGSQNAITSSDQGSNINEDVAPAHHDKDANDFAKVKTIYDRKKAAGTLSAIEDIAWIRAENEEASRLRKILADRALERSPSPDLLEDDDDDGIFVGQSTELDLSEPEDQDTTPPKKRGRKRKAAADIPPQDGEDVPRAGPSTARTKKMKQGQRQTVQGLTMTNMTGLMGSNVFEDTAEMAGLASQPTFDATNKDEAKRQLLASLPNDRAIRSEVDFLIKSTKQFSGMGSVTATDAGWIMKGMTTTLKNYQVTGTSFLRQRENDGSMPHGGILADSMGLGKSVMMIANIVNGRRAPKLKSPRATLIIASPALVNQWRQEIAKHTQTREQNKQWGLHTVLRYSNIYANGGRHAKAILEKADIVLSTYHEVSRSYPKAIVPVELSTAKEKVEWWEEYYEANRGMLHRIEWHRVVLDEAQVIKNHLSHTSMACRALEANFRWAITGTPIQNTIKEFYPYFKFLRDPHTGSYRQWKQNFVTDDGPEGGQRLRVLLSRVMLRRTYLDRMFNARLVEIPKPNEHTVWLEFSTVERSIYEIVKARFIARINMMSESGELDSQYSSLLSMILRLRMLTAHPFLIQDTLMHLMEREDFEKLSKISRSEAARNNEGGEILAHLRNVLRNRCGAKVSDGTLNSAMITTETEMAAMDGPESEEMYLTNNSLGPGFTRYLDAMQQSEFFEDIAKRALCSGCHTEPQEAHVTSCGHIYCLGCLENLAHQAARRGYPTSKCVMCEAEYTSSQPCKGPDGSRVDTSTPLVRSEGSKKPKQWIDMGPDVFQSAKTLAARCQVEVWLEQDPNSKVIIFSQFIGVLKILGRMCERQGWDYCQYNGGMSQSARSANLGAFDSMPEKKVLLASLQAGGTGLTLTMASRVIIIDQWWNESVEQQAFCRIYRIGQTKETNLTRFCIRNTIDAAMMALKVRKQGSINEVMDSKEKLSTEDIMGLFGGVGETNGRPFIFPSNPSHEDDHLRVPNMDEEDEDREMGDEE